MISLLLEQPFFGHVAASLPMSEGNTATIRFISQPFARIEYNQKWLESLPKQWTAGAVMHQLLHLILLHPFRRNGRDEALWAVACDMAVNEHIPERMRPRDAITVQAMRSEVRGLQNQCSAEVYYERVRQSALQPELLQTDLKIKVVLKNGEALSGDVFDEDEDDASQAVLEGLMAERIRQAAGETEPPTELETQIGEVYRTDRLNWRSILKRFLTGRGRFSTRKTYKRVSKRFDDFPGNRHSVGTDVLVAIDESGSIPLPLLNAFYSEALSIAEIAGVSMMVTKFDTTCTPPVSAKRFAADSVRVKSGGTDFRPVFALADSLRIPLLIIFTDGDGPAPEISNQKTLWVLTPGGTRPSLFGESVVCDLGGQR